MDKFEEQIHSNLQQYLLSVNKIDERLSECPDVAQLFNSNGWGIT